MAVHMKIWSPLLSVMDYLIICLRYYSTNAYKITFFNNYLFFNLKMTWGEKME